MRPAASRKASYVKRIRKDFPEIGIVRARLIEKGEDHDTLLVNGKTIFRFPKRKAYFSGLTHEMGLLSRISSRLQLDVPEYRFVPPDKKYGGYDIVAGTELYPARLKQLSLASARSCAKQIGEFLTALHTLTRRQLPRELGPGESYSRLALQYRRRLKRVLDLLDKKTAAFLSRFGEEFSSMGEPKRQTLIHGDLSGDHLLYDKETGKIGVIDFGDAGMGDPAYDFTFLWEYGEDFFEQVMRHYKGPAKGTIRERSKRYNINMHVSHIYRSEIEGHTGLCEQGLHRLKQIARSSDL